MTTSHVNAKVFALAEDREHFMAPDELPEDAQVTIKDTGWSEEDQARMRLAGYDGVDMVMAWYN